MYTKYQNHVITLLMNENLSASVEQVSENPGEKIRLKLERRLKNLNQSAVVGHQLRIFILHTDNFVLWPVLYFSSCHRGHEHIVGGRPNQRRLFLILAWLTRCRRLLQFLSLRETGCRRHGGGFQIPIHCLLCTFLSTTLLFGLIFHPLTTFFPLSRESVS